MDKLHIVKLGGGLLEDSSATATALTLFMHLLDTKSLSMAVVAKPVYSVKNWA